MAKLSMEARYGVRQRKALLRMLRDSSARVRIRAMDREDSKHIPVIALTANAFDEDVQRSLQTGLNAHLSKPVQPDTLFATLEEML